MLTSLFATKLGMSQAWDTAGKRWPVTKCQVGPNVVLGQQADSFLIGYGSKKQKNMSKPLRSIVAKSGFSGGVKQIKGVRPVQATDEAENTDLKPGATVQAQAVLKVGDVVKVQGVSKGRGFAGAMKRHNFHGGPATHGQSDRARAVGSIGAGTTPGKVLKGKKMPGQYGAKTKTVSNLVVLHVDEANQEVWLSGPVPGHLKGIVRITHVGRTKEIELNKQASGIAEPVVADQSAEEAAVEATSPAEVDETPAEKTDQPTKETK